MPQMDYYVDVLNPGLLEGRAKETVWYGNWPATMSDAMMAVGVLSDDRPRYERGLALYRATVEGYLRWGRGRYAKGRMIGETTETLRDGEQGAGRRHAARRGGEGPPHAAWRCLTASGRRTGWASRLTARA
jgi:hypothetical protein